MSQRIAVVAPSAVPFVRGGAERMCEGLVDAINELTPHVGELIRIPARESSLATFLDSYETFARLDVSHFDTVISCKYPAWMIDHPNHLVYMQHTARLFYELYPPREPQELPDLAVFEPLTRLLARAPERAFLDDVLGTVREIIDLLGEGHPAARPGPVLHNLLPWLDHLGIAAARRHFSISATVANRPRYFPPGLRPEVLIPPSGTPGLHTGDFLYFFTASRLEELKRIDLLIDAMRYVPGQVRLKIAGVGSETTPLRVRAMNDRRIEFLGSVSDRELVELYAGALAVPFVPFDEDLGLITLEAFESGKPVITCRDSGGPAEIVLDGQTGFVADSTPEAVGAALSTFARDPKRAHDMGRIARSHVDRYSWRRVLDRLLEPRSEARALSFPKGRRRVAMVSTTPIWPADSAMAERAVGMARALAADCDVLLVSPARPPASAHAVTSADSLQIDVPAPPEAVEDTDCDAPWHPRETDWGQGEFRVAVERATRQAATVVLLDLGLVSLVRGFSPDLPLVIDVPSVVRHTGGNVEAVPVATLNEAIAITAPSEAIARRLISSGVPEDRVVVVPYPTTPVGLVHRVDGREAARADLAAFTGTAPDGLRVVVVDPGCRAEWEAVEPLATALVEEHDDILVVFLGSTSAPPLTLPKRLIPLPHPGARRLSALVACSDHVVAAGNVPCSPSRAALEALHYGIQLGATSDHAALIGSEATVIDGMLPDDLEANVRNPSSRGPEPTSADRHTSLTQLADTISEITRVRTGLTPAELPWRLRALR